MAVTMLDPSEQQRILDPACGTGGFLITAMNHVIGKVVSAERQKGGSERRVEDATRARVQKFASRFIVGIDLNPNLVKAAKMNMVMNNDGSGGLYQGNSLANPARWGEDLRDRNLIGSIDLLFTNPPFGSKIVIDDPSILEQYELGHAWAYDADADTWEQTGSLQKSQPPEILVIERCVRFLRPGTGRMAIVVPDGILGSPGLGYVREWILRNARVLASIDMHPDTFQPSVSVQTSLLILQRKEEELVAMEGAAGHMNDYEVFMALANHIGHDKRGNRTYVRDANGNEIVEEVTEQLKEYEARWCME
jgi:type I restriction enzyme M protein